MAPQQYSWSCSICSFTWVINATDTDSSLSREEASTIIGYPYCVNESYGLMSAQCMIDAFSHYGLTSKQAWVTYDEAYAIMRDTTGIINALGMYHVMGMRGVDYDIDALWVANSAPGYRGVYETLTREQFNSLGPVQVIYLAQ
jgi:hypothetical protein